MVRQSEYALITLTRNQLRLTTEEDCKDPVKACLSGYESPVEGFYL